MKLETSNLAYIWTGVSTNETAFKIRSKGVSLGSRDPLLEFWDPLISPEQLKLETSNLTHRWMTESLTKKNAKFSQNGLCRVT